MFVATQDNKRNKRKDLRATDLDTKTCPQEMRDVTKQ